MAEIKQHNNRVNRINCRRRLTIYMKKITWNILKWINIYLNIKWSVLQYSVIITYDIGELWWYYYAVSRLESTKILQKEVEQWLFISKSIQLNFSFQRFSLNWKWEWETTSCGTYSSLIMKVFYSKWSSFVRLSHCQRTVHIYELITLLSTSTTLLLYILYWQYFNDDWGVYGKKIILRKCSWHKRICINTMIR